MLESSAWIKVPGTYNVQVYPIIRKPSVTCANSFIFKTSDCIIIFDPGADPEQIKHIKRIVLPIKEERDIPVYIFITHCHIDHILSVPMLMEEDINGRIVCHNICAEAIEKRDDNLTLANMNGSILPTCSVSARFFISDNPHNAGNSLNDGYGESMPFRQIAGKGEKEAGYPSSVSLTISQKDVLDIFHTPGHSPDMTCYGLGSFLFTGDLHLATSPGIAGKAGWDNRALAASLDGIIKVGKERNTSWVIPGHGHAIPFEKAKIIFEKVRKEADRLNNLTRLDKTRSLYLSDYSLALLEEAGNIFSIISGRLLKVSYYLEMLEEDEFAQEILRYFDSDSIEKMVDEFHYFKMELKKKEGAPVISKAVQFVRKVNKIISPDAISHLVDESLLRRLNSILTDFINVMHGIRFQYQETLFDVNEAVTELMETLREKPYEEESIFDAAEDIEKYMHELVIRIAHKPLFSSVIFDFKPSYEKILISTDRDAFLDLITAAIEPLAAGGEKYVRLELESSRGKANLYLTTQKSEGAALIRTSKNKYIKHSIRVCGGDFNETTRTGVDGHVFQFPLAGS